MTQLAATKATTKEQMEYNEQLQALYYDPDYGYGTPEYSEILLELQSDHEFELASLTAWESQLDIQKENLETQLNEITGYESAWQKLLQQNIKVDFTFGGSGGGK